MSNVIHVREFSPIAGQQFFFDNNIWMFLYCPIANFAEAKQRAYAGVLERIRVMNCNIFFNSLVCSEFANAWIRKEFDRWAEINSKKATTFKSEFVGSKDYLNAVEDIESAVFQIGKITQQVGDDFNSIFPQIEKIFQNYKYCDFNDCYYLELARRRNWVIVSDDADLLGRNVQGVKVVTARKL